MRRNHVLVLTTTFPRWKQDTTPRFVYELSSRLSSAFPVTVLAPHHPGAKKREKAGKMNVRRFTYFYPKRLQRLCYGGGIIPNMRASFLAKMQLPLLFFSAFFSASSKMSKEDVTLIHAHWILPQGLIGALLARKYDTPFLVTIHGSDLFALQNPFFKKIQRFVLNSATVITVNSEATKSELFRKFPKTRKKTRIIPMGVDTASFMFKKAKKPDEYKKNKIILSVGRLSDQKGLQYVVDALSPIIEKEPLSKLLIIGEGPYKKELRRKIKEKNLTGHVEFLGALPKEQIAKYYSFADVFVFPSLSTKTGTEALGLALMEAMATGCPVIGSDIGGIPSLITPNKTGLLVKQKNPAQLSTAILTLIKERKKAEKLGRNASLLIRKNYSWNDITKKFERIYRETMRIK